MRLIGNKALRALGGPPAAATLRPGPLDVVARLI